MELEAPARSPFGEDLERPNYVRFRLGPDASIAIGVRSKKPGEAMVGAELELLASQGLTDEMDAYERLLGDAMKGDATLFAREDSVEAEWRIVAPILTPEVSPHEHEPGSWGSAEADRLVAGDRGWHRPIETATTPTSSQPRRSHVQ